MNLPYAVQLALLTAALAAVVFAVVYTLKLVTRYVKANVSLQTWDLMTEKAAVVVRYLEQAVQFVTYTGPDKKQYALSTLLETAKLVGLNIVENSIEAAANKVGLVITHDDIDRLIEAAVHDMNVELGKFAVEELVPSTLTPGAVTPQ
jgi:hypothetical protein